MALGYERDYLSFPRYDNELQLGCVVNLAVEHEHSLGESRSTLVADQFMDRFFWFSWYGICTRDHRVINILWQEFIGGGGIGRPPDSDLYGARDSSILCGVSSAVTVVFEGQI